MVTQELHIALDELLQKVNSHWNSNFLPQEKDNAINREILKFIKQRLNPLSNFKRLSVFDTLKRNQDLASLIKTIPVKVLTINPKEVAIQLPFDFLYYVGTNLNITPSCDVKNIVPIQTTIYFKSIPAIIDVNNLTNLLIRCTQGGQELTLFNLVDLPDGYIPTDNLPSYKKNFIINNAILEFMKKNIQTEIEVRYNKINNTFEFKSLAPFNINVIKNNVISVALGASQTYDSYSLESTLTSTVRIVDEEFKGDIQNSSLSKGKDQSLIGYLRPDIIIIPKVKNVVINSAFLTYFCKPAKVDLLLGFNSNLSDEVLDEVINNTAKQLKGIIASDTYDKFSQENLLIE